MTNPPTTGRTISLPDCRKPSVDGPTVIGLRVRGFSTEFTMDPHGIAWLIGTSPSCEICLHDDVYVSAVHAALVRRDDGLHLIDKSKNGTWCNRQRVSRAYVADGAQIRVGLTDLIAYSEASRCQLVPIERIVGVSEHAARLRREIHRAATGGHALLVGEAGSGRRTVAEAIHQASTLAPGPFVVVDCESLPYIEIPHELFGANGLGGAAAAATGGTLCIVGVELLPSRCYPRLLRILCGNDVATLGPLQLIAITSQPSVAAARDWKWLSETVRVVHVPPLRERLEDVAALAYLFAREMRLPGAPRLPPTELAALRGYPWPGNVAELRAVVRRALAECETELRFGELWKSRQEMEAALRVAMAGALHSAGSLRKASESLGMTWTTFRRFARRFGLMAAARNDGDAPADNPEQDHE